MEREREKVCEREREREREVERERIKFEVWPWCTEYVLVIVADVNSAMTGRWIDWLILCSGSSTISSVVILNAGVAALTDRKATKTELDLKCDEEVNLGGLMDGFQTTDGTEPIFVM